MGVDSRDELLNYTTPELIESMDKLKAAVTTWDRNRLTTSSDDVLARVADLRLALDRYEQSVMKY